jgi:hypothetical protein
MRSAWAYVSAGRVKQLTVRACRSSTAVGSVWEWSPIPRPQQDWYIHGLRPDPSCLKVPCVWLHLCLQVLPQAWQA